MEGTAGAGVNVHVDAGALPKEERLHGKHVEAYAKGTHAQAHKVQFSSYSTKKINPAEFLGGPPAKK